MRYSFRPDDCMVITIPLGSIGSTTGGDLMPDKFSCVFKDVYKVFLKGRPKAVGAAQLITGIFILCLGAVYIRWHGIMNTAHIGPSAMFLACGTLTYAAGHAPLMPVMKLSFVLNIIGLFWAAVALVICLLTFGPNMDYFSYRQNVSREHMQMKTGLMGVLTTLYVLQFFLSAVMIFWQSKAVCRVHFNTLPMITLKQDT